MTPERRRWTPGEALAWYENQPWFAGCNFIPSTAVNQLEMWQADTFDPATIERELGWAHHIGFNAARVFLHDLLWQDDTDGFTERINRYLTIACDAGISTLFVLFDGVWDPQPALGPQREPRSRVHNSGWVQGPGAAVLGDPARHDLLEPYVSGVIERFRDDERILGWDLFNEPDNPNPAYARTEVPKKAEMAAALLRESFRWARSANPTQPITAGVWRGALVGDDVPEINRLMLDESDVISFHSYMDADRVDVRIRQLEAYERPILLSEFMSRDSGSTFKAILPIAKQHKVGAFCWGLVSGKTQTIYPWDSWVKQYDAEPDPWFHDVFRPDGTPYRQSETEFIREITDRGAS